MRIISLNYYGGMICCHSDKSFSSLDIHLSCGVSSFLTIKNYTALDAPADQLCGTGDLARLSTREDRSDDAITACIEEKIDKYVFAPSHPFPPTQAPTSRPTPTLFLPTGAPSAFTPSASPDIGGPSALLIGFLAAGITVAGFGLLLLLFKLVKKYENRAAERERQWVINVINHAVGGRDGEEPDGSPEGDVYDEAASINARPFGMSL